MSKVMLYPFFELAARSPTRQIPFRWLVGLRLSTITGIIALALAGPLDRVFPTLAFVVLTMGIVEGALVLGWRLAQLPKNNALESLLLSPVPPIMTMLGEQLVGLALFTFLVLSSLPMLLVLYVTGWLLWWQVLLIPALEWIWGCVTGFGLAWWAYEPSSLRKWGERCMFLFLLFYLVVGGLVGEKTVVILNQLPIELGTAIDTTFRFGIENNPFGLIEQLSRGVNDVLLQRVAEVHLVGLLFLLFFLFRGAARLKPHYVERHYRPLTESDARKRGAIGLKPLSWWAVQRVKEYPGGLNLWLAAGASLAYAAFLYLGPAWPDWLGVGVFIVFERLGGVSAFGVMLALLTAVPAAYQYGLWDSSIPARCRRLEVFLLTRLTAWDYLAAAWSASWYRGRGYFAIAVVLWFLGAYAGRYPFTQAVLVTLLSLSMTAFYFAVGFRLLAGSNAGTNVGFVLTVALPLLTWALGAAKRPDLASWLPPGLIYYATQPSADPWQAGIGITVMSLAAVVLIQQALLKFDAEIRTWYTQNHGKR